MTLPFTRGVPLCCGYVITFIEGFYKFSEGFSQQNEMDDLLKKVIIVFVDFTNISAVSRKSSCTKFKQFINADYKHR